MAILVLFSILLFFALLMTGILITTYGKPIDDDLVVEWVEKCRAGKGFESNLFDRTIISGYMGDDSYRSSRYFTQPPIPILFKYYIDGVGLVWRWSKGAKALDQVCNELYVGSNKESQRKKLGL
jgi:hypothetical protein